MPPTRSLPRLVRPATIPDITEENLCESPDLITSIQSPGNSPPSSASASPVPTSPVTRVVIPPLNPADLLSLAVSLASTPGQPQPERQDIRTSASRQSSHRPISSLRSHALVTSSPLPASAPATPLPTRQTESQQPDEYRTGHVWDTAQGDVDGEREPVGVEEEEDWGDEVGMEEEEEEPITLRMASPFPPLPLSRAIPAPRSLLRPAPTRRAALIQEVSGQTLRETTTLGEADISHNLLVKNFLTVAVFTIVATGGLLGSAFRRDRERLLWKFESASIVLSAVSCGLLYNVALSQRFGFELGEYGSSRTGTNSRLRIQRLLAHVVRLISVHLTAEVNGVQTGRVSTDTDEAIFRCFARQTVAFVGILGRRGLANSVIAVLAVASAHALFGVLAWSVVGVLCFGFALICIMLSRFSRWRMGSLRVSRHRESAQRPFLQGLDLPVDSVGFRNAAMRTGDALGLYGVVRPVEFPPMVHLREPATNSSLRPPDDNARVDASLSQDLMELSNSEADSALSNHTDHSETAPEDIGHSAQDHLRDTAADVGDLGSIDLILPVAEEPLEEALAGASHFPVLQQSAMARTHVRDELAPGVTLEMPRSPSSRSRSPTTAPPSTTRPTTPRSTASQQITPRPTTPRPNARQSSGRARLSRASVRTVASQHSAAAGAMSSLAMRTSPTPLLTPDFAPVPLHRRESFVRRGPRGHRGLSAARQPPSSTSIPARGRRGDTHGQVLRATPFSSSPATSAPSSSSTTRRMELGSTASRSRSRENRNVMISSRHTGDDEGIRSRPARSYSPVQNWQSAQERQGASEILDGFGPEYRTPVGEDIAVPGFGGGGRFRRHPSSGRPSALQHRGMGQSDRLRAARRFRRVYNFRPLVASDDEQIGASFSGSSLDLGSEVEEVDDDGFLDIDEVEDNDDDNVDVAVSVGIDVDIELDEAESGSRVGEILTGRGTGPIASSSTRMTYRRMARRLAAVSRDFTDADYEMLLALDEEARPRISRRGASRSMIRNLASYTYTPSAPCEEGASENCTDGCGPEGCESQSGRGLYEERCSVCLESYAVNGKICVLPCKHEFCECVERWLLSTANCPICRAPVLREQVIPASS